MSKTQKIILTAIVFLVLVVAGFALYYFYLKKTPVIIKGPRQQQGTATLPQGNIEIIDSKLKKISATAAISPVSTADGKKVLYVGGSGGIFDVAFDGGDIKETPFVALQNLFGVLWSKDRNEFAALYRTPEGREMHYYNAPRKQTLPYNTSIKALAFSKTDNRIAYHSFDSSRGSNAVFVANADGSVARTVFATRLEDARLAWITDKKIALSTAPSGLAQNILWTLDIETQKITSVLSQVNGMTFLWNQKGDRVLFSQTNGEGKDLSLMSADQNGGEVKKTGVETLPEKCVFAQDGKSAVCALPKTAPDIMWPDDYYKKLYDAQEQIWKINIETGKKDLLYEFAQDKKFDAANLVLSPSEDYLVFTNRKDDRLYSLKL